MPKTGKDLGRLMTLENDRRNASLLEMPTEVLEHIFRYSGSEYACKGHAEPKIGGLPTLLSVQQTCRYFNDLLKGDEVWAKLFPHCTDIEYKYQTTARERVFISEGLRGIRKWQNKNARGIDNIILAHLGGADGVRRVIEALLKRMWRQGGPLWLPYLYGMDRSMGGVVSFEPVLRGDTIHYLTEVIQEHMITRLAKANVLAIEYQSEGYTQHGHLEPKPGDSYPETCAKDRVLDRLTLTGNDTACVHCSIVLGAHPGNCLASSDFWKWPDDNCCDEEILGSSERSKMVRALAFRAGIVKMSGEVFALMAAEILHHLAVLTASAFDESYAQGSGTGSPNEEAASATRYNNYYTEYCPPRKWEDDGKIECVIIPRQIKDAAVRVGMRPLVGYAKFGAHWAPRNENSKQEEVKEAIARYDVDTSEFQYQSEGSCNIGSESEEEERDWQKFKTEHDTDYSSSNSYDSDEDMSYAEDDPGDDENGDDAVAEE